MNEIEFSKYKNDKRIIIETIAQIEKDFSEFEISINPNSILSLDILAQKLIGIIASLQIENHQKLYNLLYRIDVSEDRIKKVVQKNINDPIECILAYLVAEREFQKVVIRNYYSNKLI